ncbi:LppA family lipoprotein [Mycolicibacterium mengxianglii]|uniref:LppA family lipoprotein n=1 Tax=Mycolicibacterium mengxianglii TaxID=2736649 RepID=UPI0018D13277|nr:LppA family lipoprotein [Mycolicibacterium mengxianglii]
MADNISVTEQDWAEIAASAKRVAAGLGATDIAVMRDKPGSHDVWFTGPSGLFIKVGYSKSLVVAGYTGCRLRPAW